MTSRHVTKTTEQERLKRDDAAIVSWVNFVLALDKRASASNDDDPAEIAVLKKSKRKSRQRPQSATELVQPLCSAKEMSDGVHLCLVAERVTGEKLRGGGRRGGRAWYLEPRHQVHRHENVTMALEALRKHGYSFVNVGPDDFVQGNEKLIVSAMSCIVRRFQLGSSGRESMLQWFSTLIDDDDSTFDLYDIDGETLMLALGTLCQERGFPMPLVSEDSSEVETVAEVAWRCFGVPASLLREEEGPLVSTFALELWLSLLKMRTATKQEEVPIWLPPPPIESEREDTALSEETKLEIARAARVETCANTAFTESQVKTSSGEKLLLLQFDDSVSDSVKQQLLPQDVSVSFESSNGFIAEDVHIEQFESQIAIRFRALRCLTSATARISVFGHVCSHVPLFVWPRGMQLEVSPHAVLEAVRPTVSVSDDTVSLESHSQYSHSEVLKSETVTGTGAYEITVTPTPSSTSSQTVLVRAHFESDTAHFVDLASLDMCEVAASPVVPVAPAPSSVAPCSVSPVALCIIRMLRDTCQMRHGTPLRELAERADVIDITRVALFNEETQADGRKCELTMSAKLSNLAAADSDGLCYAAVFVNGALSLWQSFHVAQIDMSKCEVRVESPVVLAETPLKVQATLAVQSLPFFNVPVTVTFAEGEKRMECPLHRSDVNTFNGAVALPQGDWHVTAALEINQQTVTLPVTLLTAPSFLESSETSGKPSSVLSVPTVNAADFRVDVPPNVEPNTICVVEVITTQLFATAVERGYVEIAVLPDGGNPAAEILSVSTRRCDTSKSQKRVVRIACVPRVSVPHATRLRCRALALAVLADVFSVHEEGRMRHRYLVRIAVNRLLQRSFDHQLDSATRDLLLRDAFGELSDVRFSLPCEKAKSKEPRQLIDSERDATEVELRHYDALVLQYANALQQRRRAATVLAQLLSGISVLKFAGGASSARPKLRKLLVTSDVASLYWFSGRNKRKDVPLASITSVQVGKKTAALARGALRRYPPELCASVVSAQRTVDLMFENRRDRDCFVEAFRTILLYRREKVLRLLRDTSARVSADVAFATSHE
ncbi:MAG: hypothetical protein MHM6MM_005692 [Cercozoa sp. M6MM]